MCLVLDGRTMDDKKILSTEEAIKTIYEALETRGYEPSSQILRYVTSNDPNFITRHNNARGIITQMDKDELLLGLADYIDHMKYLAYQDVMTATRNKAAYFEKIRILKNQIAENCAKFEICIFDVNNLKLLNDTQGHAKGDLLIMDVARLLMDAMGEKNVYRIGGDEFAVILDADKISAETRIIRFNMLLEKHNSIPHPYDQPITVACGCSTYQSGDSFDIVFSRADEQMYMNKKKLKGEL